MVGRYIIIFSDIFFVDLAAAAIADVGDDDLQLFDSDDIETMRMIWRRVGRETIGMLLFSFI